MRAAARRRGGAAAAPARAALLLLLLAAAAPAGAGNSSGNCSGCGSPGPAAPPGATPAPTIAPLPAAYARCAKTQVSTGHTCCDDPDGLLEASGAHCPGIAPDATAHCKRPVAERVGLAWPVPGQTVAQLCPKLCQNQAVPGCECPKAYDRGCPDKNCIAPTKDPVSGKSYDWGPTCDECEVWGAHLLCTKPGTDTRTVCTAVLAVVLVLTAAATTAYGVRSWKQVRGAARGSQYQVADQRRRASQPGRSPRARPGPPRKSSIAIVVTNATTCLEVYRLMCARTFYNFGWYVATHRVAFFVAVEVVMISFIVLGLCIPSFPGLLRTNMATTSVDMAPEGGRLQQQMEFWNKWGPTSTSTFGFVFLMVGPEAYDGSGPGCLAQKYVHHTHQLLLEIQNITVPVTDANGKTIHISHNDFCVRIPETQVFNAFMPGEKPCLNPGPLDCFFEGMWQFENTQLEGRGVHWPPTTTTTTTTAAGDLAVPEMVQWQDPPSPVVTNLDRAVQILNAIYDDYKPIKSYRGRPSYKNMTEAEILHRFQLWQASSGRLTKASTKKFEGCTHWASMQKQAHFGGIVSDPPFVESACPIDKANEPDYKMVSAQLMATILPLNSMDAVRMGRVSLQEVSLDEIIRAGDEWQDRVMAHLEAADGDEARYPGTRVSALSSNAIEKMMEDLAADAASRMVGGYFLMLVYVLLSQIDVKKCIHNLTAVAAFYFFSVIILSNLATLGLLAFLDITVNRMIMQIVPFIALGLGCDDMFLLLHYYRAVPNKSRPAAEVVADLMYGGGRSVSLTSLTNFLAFFGAGASVDIPAFRHFCVAAGLVVTWNYVACIICLPAILAAWTDLMRDRGELCGCDGGVPTSPSSPRAASGAAGGLQRVIERYVSPVLQRKPVQVTLTAMWAAFFVFSAVAIAAIAPLDIGGGDITEFASEGSYARQGIVEYARTVDGGKYSHKWVVVSGGDGGGVDMADPVVQARVQLTAADIGTAAEVWFPDMTHWVTSFYLFALEENNTQHPDEAEVLIVQQPPAGLPGCELEGTQAQTRAPARAGAASGCSQHLLCNNHCLRQCAPRPGTEPNCAQPGDEAIYAACVDAGNCSYPEVKLPYAAGYPWYVPREHFYRLFHKWRHPIDGGVNSLVAVAMGHQKWGYQFGADRFNPIPGCQRATCNDTNGLVFTFSSWSADARCLKTPDDWLQHIDSMRGRIGAQLGEAYAWPLPEGKFFDYEQFKTTRRFFFVSTLISWASTFAAAILVPVSVAGAAIITFCAILSSVELAAVAMLLDLEFNTYVALLLVVGIGMVVDPVVHMVSAYEHAEEIGRGARLDHAIRRTAIPILEGGFSSVLSFILLGFSDVIYLRKYSFLAFLCVVLIGVVHGVVLLPALLGLVGSKEAPGSQPGTPRCKRSPVQSSRVSPRVVDSVALSEGNMPDLRAEMVAAPLAVNTVVTVPAGDQAFDIPILPLAGQESSEKGLVMVKPAQAAGGTNTPSSDDPSPAVRAADLTVHSS